MKKKQLGQFFTTNSDYILQGFEDFIIGKNIIDPFAGGGDLLDWAKRNKAKKVLGYDIDDNLIDNKKIFKNDSLKNSLEYKKNDFVLSNPPYLNINKADKDIKKYFSDFEDLYQVAISKILNSFEGILIVPVNFLSAENSKKIRNLFFEKFEIVKVNYFKEQVFDDTTYNVIAFYYKLKNKYTILDNLLLNIFPEKKEYELSLEKKYDWTIGGDFSYVLKSQKNFLGAYRLTERDLEKGEVEILAGIGHVKEKSKLKIKDSDYKKVKSNILLLKAIDTGSKNGKIALEDISKYNIDCLISKESSRNQIQILFKNKIDLTEQKKIIELFNKEIEVLREKYLSLFMTNFRDKDRKRISFDFSYKLINYVYYNKMNKYERQSTLF